MLYGEALAWLYDAQNRGIKLGLDRVHAFLAALGWRHEQRFLHVAGTNGKGSVCAMLDSICRAAGMRTGLFTSPHLVTFRERIQLSGAKASAGEIARELTHIRDVCERTGMEPTFFEITTAVALEIFRKQECGIIILETGMGGRLDATNVVRPEVAVITSIGLDHTDFLGRTLAEIAWEKAGIIKPGVPVVTGPLPAEAAAVVAEVAATQGAPLFEVIEPERDAALGLKGAHQQMNAAMAVRALEVAGIAIPPDQAAEGLRNVVWPARFQDTGTGFILDGAHNPDAAKHLADTWREEYGDRKTEVILGIVRDKDAGGICAELASVAERFTIVPVRSPRAGRVEDLLEIARAWRPCRLCRSLDEAIVTTRHGETPALITGSFFLMGEALVSLGLADEEQEISAQ